MMDSRDFMKDWFAEIDNTAHAVTLCNTGWRVFTSEALYRVVYASTATV